MRRIACGYLCVDIYPQHDLLAIGGEATNFALRSIAAGERVDLVVKHGEDHVGEALRALMLSQGIPAEGVLQEPVDTAYCVVLTEGVDRKFPIASKGPYVTHPLRVEDLHLAPEDPASVHLDFASIHLLAPLLERSNVLVSADFRRSWFEYYPHLAHVTFVSLAADDDPEALARKVEAKGFEGVLVMTKGPEGSFAWSHGELHHVAAPVIEVVDSTGAGDAYQAGFMREYVRSQDVRASMASGTEWGATACGHLGASAPDLAVDGAIRLEMLDFARRCLGWESGG